MSNGCNQLSALDPVQGLVDFILDIKPFHTKIIEVIVEYVHNDLVDVTILEDLDLDVYLVYPDPENALKIGSCPIIDKQIWGAMTNQTVFQLDTPLPYLDRFDEFNGEPGQTLFELSAQVKNFDVANIQKITVNGTITTSYSLGVNGRDVTITSPAIQGGDIVAVTYTSVIPDTTHFTVTVNGVPAAFRMNSISELQITSPLPLALNDLVVAVQCGEPFEQLICADGYDTTPYDDPDSFSFVTTLSESTEEITIGGNRSQDFVRGTEITLRTRVFEDVGSPLVIPTEVTDIPTLIGLGINPATDLFRKYTVLSSAFDAGGPSTLPSTTITVDDNIRGIDPLPTLSSPYSYRYSVGVAPVSILNTLGYSNVVNLPQEQPDEGTLTLTVIDIDETANTIEVEGDLSSSNIAAGDTFNIINAPTHQQQYAVASLVSSGSPATTVITVTEDILVAGPAVGESPLARFDIASNVFIITGDQTQRFAQGKLFVAENSPNAGSYVTLTSDSRQVEVGRESFVASAGQTVYTFTGSPPLSIPGTSPQGTELGVPDPTLLRVFVIRSGEKFEAVAQVNSSTEFEIIAGPLPIEAGDTVTGVVLDRRTRIRPTRDVVKLNSSEGRIKDFPLGYGSQQVFCSSTPGTLVRVAIAETLSFSNTELTFSDDLIAYNLENTDQVVYDGVPFGTEFSPIPPSSSPMVYDYWYSGLPIMLIDDVNDEIIVGGDWTSLFTSSYEFTVLESTINGGNWTVSSSATDSSSTYFPSVPVFTVTKIKVTGNLLPETLSAGEIIVDPTTTALYPPAVYQWDTVEWRLLQRGFSAFNPATSQRIQTATESFLAVEGQTVFTFTGSPPSLSVSGSPLDDSLLRVYVNGVRVESRLNSSTEFEIIDANIVPKQNDLVRADIYNDTGEEFNAYINTFDGEPHEYFHDNVVGNESAKTIVLKGGNYVDRMTPDRVLIGTTTASGSPLGSPLVIGEVGRWRPVSAVFNSSTFETTVTVAAEGSPAPSLDDIEAVSYIWIGPLRFQIDIEQSDLIPNTILDGLGISNELLTIPDRYTIIGVNLGGSPLSVCGSPGGSPVLNSFIIRAVNCDLGGSPCSIGSPLGGEPIDLTNVFLPNSTFRIQGSFNSLNNQPGFGSPNVQLPWTVACSQFDPNTGNTIITVKEPINDDTVPYGFIIRESMIVGQRPESQTSASITEMLDFGWGTTLRWDIIGTNVSTDTIFLPGDLTGSILKDDRGRIIGSLDNDGQYRVTSVNYNAGSGRTEVSLVRLVFKEWEDPDPGSPPGSPIEELSGIFLGSPTLGGSPSGSPYLLGGIFQLDGIDITNWFQYNLVGANSVSNTLVLWGNATTKIQSGQEILVLSSPGNDGLYKVHNTAAPVFDGTKTFVTIDPSSPTSVTVDQGVYPGSPKGSPVVQGGGFVQSVRDYGIFIYFEDTIGMQVFEDATTAVVTIGGNLVGAWDYPYWDIGSFDENVEVVVHLYGNTFQND